MAAPETIHQLLREAAGLVDLRQVSPYEGGQAWLVGFDDATTFDIEFDSELNRIVLSGVIGEVPLQCRLGVYEVLLQYNHAWIETGGVRMALDGEASSVVMMFEMPAADLHVAQLASVLAKLREIQDAWRQILAHLQQTVHGSAASRSMWPDAHTPAFLLRG